MRTGSPSVPSAARRRAQDFLPGRRVTHRPRFRAGRGTGVLHGLGKTISPNNVLRRWADIVILTDDEPRCTLLRLTEGTRPASLPYGGALSAGRSKVAPTIAV